MNHTNPAAILDRPAGDRQKWFRLVTPELDSEGTITLPEGGNLDRFKQNPVFCWNHPLGKTAPDGTPPPPPDPEDVIGKVVDYAQSPAALDILVEFATHEQAQLCYDLVCGDFLRAVSYCGPIQRQEDRDIGGKMIPVIAEWELWEASLCIVGSNPGALAIQRAIQLAARTAPTETAARTSPASETKPTAAKKGVQVDKESFHAKMGMPGDGDRKSAAAAVMRYLASTTDTPEDRAKVCSAMEAHYPAESDGEEAPKGKDAADGDAAESDEDKAKREETEKAARDAEGDPDTMDEKAVRSALKVERIARKMSQRAATLVPAVSPETVVVAEVDKLIDEGQVERTPVARAAAIEAHREGLLLPALKLANIKLGTFTTSQRLGGGRVGTVTEMATRSAAAGTRKTTADAEVDAAADAAINRIQNVGAERFMPAAKKVS